MAMNEREITTSTDNIFDLVIVGGGFAGAALATVMGRKGHRIAVIDVNETFPQEYRAEKIGGEQLDLLRRLGLLEGILSYTTPVRSMMNMRRGFLVDRREVEEYGILYHDNVAALRAQIPGHVDRVIGRVVDIELSAETQRVILNDGRIVKGRLVVLATGVSDALRRRVGVTRRMVQKNQCFSAGWTIAPPTTGFDFPALTVYGERAGDGVDYLSFFPLGKNMRANLFMFTEPRNPVVAEIKADPLKAAGALMPGLGKMIRGCTLAEGPSLHSVDLYICENVRQNGLVLIGDAFRTSCPAVGSGLTCALQDVERLAIHADAWLATAGMGQPKIQQFYDDPIKNAMDARAHALAASRRKAAIDADFLTVARRNARFAARVVRDRIRYIGRPSSKGRSKAADLKIS